MKQIIKKVLSICMISTLVLSMLLSSLQRVSADESENIPNSPIKVLEENISDESIDNIDNNVMARRTTSSWKKHISQ